MASSFTGALPVIDADTHLTESWDLWTRRAPARFADGVPRVETVDGNPMWIFGGTPLGPAGASCVIRPDGLKELGAGAVFDSRIWTSHPGAYELAPRLELMDQMGVWAQIVYPNTVGFGGQKLAHVDDLELRVVTTKIWNDTMAELQAESGGRLLPMAVIPWWDIDQAVAEVERVHAMGLRGVNTNADPQNQGLPDLAERHWDPLWEAVSSLGLPVNFHLGASATQASFGRALAWPSYDRDEALAIGTVLQAMGNARVLANMIYSGALERFPALNLVSVESGIGWIPYFLEGLDYQLGETAPHLDRRLSMLPSEYFTRQVYACFWFEHRNLVSAIETVGVDNCLFETDFPHPTCLYPDPLPRVLDALQGTDDEFRRKVLFENAARVYSIPLPDGSETPTTPA